MKMSLADIKSLLNQDNIVFCQIPTSEGQVTDVVADHKMQGLLVPQLDKSWMTGPVKISCGKSLLYVVKVREKYYEIHNSKTAYLRFQKQK